MIKERNIAVCIILTIVTCGIYGLYWLYTMAEDCKVLTGRTEDMSGVVVVLLSIVTCTIFLWFWLYKTGSNFDELDQANGLPQKNRGVLYLILGLFGLSIVAYALIQNEINARA